MRSICALYTVRAGSGGICDGDVGVGEGENNGLVGDVGLRDGRGVPDSLGGTRRRRPAGKRRRRESSAGFVAKRVMDNRRGRTRRSHDVGKGMGREGGSREIRAE